MKKKGNRRLIISLAVVALIYVAGFIVEQTCGSKSMAVTVLQKGAVYALIAVSMNLLNGFTGLFSLGQAGFMLIGAYSYAILTIPMAKRAAVYQYYDGGIVQFTIGMIPALLVAGIVGPLTNGSNLLKTYPTLKTVMPGNTLLFTFIVVGICIGLILLLINSTYGRAFKAIRDDEIAAEAMGINLFHHKQMAFVISCFFAGIGGALLAMYQGTLQANGFKSAMTYEILLIVVIGGLGSVSGSIIASFLFIACSEWWLRFLDTETMIGDFKVPLLAPGFRMVAFSVVIMVVVLFFRKGIMGDRELWDLGSRRKAKGGSDIK